MPASRFVISMRLKELGDFSTAAAVLGRQDHHRTRLSRRSSTMSAVPATKERTLSDDRRADGRTFLAFPLQDQVPTELREVLCDFVWDSAKLQRLPLPVGTATVDSLRWHLHLPYWRHDGKPFQVTPSQVRADPARYREHYQRTMAADLGCPLDLLFRNGRWVILDGVHRLLKADLLGLNNVQVRRLPAAMLALIL